MSTICLTFPRPKQTIPCHPKVAMLPRQRRTRLEPGTTCPNRSTLSNAPTHHLRVSLLYSKRQQSSSELKFTVQKTTSCFSLVSFNICFFQKYFVKTCKVRTLNKIKWCRLSSIQKGLIFQIRSEMVLKPSHNNF